MRSKRLGGAWSEEAWLLDSIPDLPELYCVFWSGFGTRGRVPDVVCAWPRAGIEFGSELEEE